MTVRHDERRERALEREKDRKNRTPQQQLNVLDDKLGKGVGAKKERARLLKKINKER